MLRICFVFLATAVFTQADPGNCVPLPEAGDDLKPLSEVEATGLQFAREEEKMARDVYLAMFDLWGLRPFQNIATRGETHHMAAMKTLLDRYDLADPVKDEQNRGTFSNADIQALHDRLVKQGKASLEAAISAGLEIEEYDIKDLIARKNASDHEDIVTAYTALIGGSERHLQAFHRHATMREITYTPKHLTPEQFQSHLGASAAGCSPEGCSNEACDEEGCGTEPGATPPATPGSGQGRGPGWAQGGQGQGQGGGGGQGKGRRWRGGRGAATATPAP